MVHGSNDYKMGYITELQLAPIARELEVQCLSNDMKVPISFVLIKMKDIQDLCGMLAGKHQTNWKYPSQVGHKIN